MRTLFLLFFFFLSFPSICQNQLNFTQPVDTGSGTDRVIVYPNVTVWNGQALDMIVYLDGYSSSDPSDTLWYDDVQFRAVSGDFNIKIPYLDYFVRCVDLTYKFVEAGTQNDTYLDLSATIFDLDSSNLRKEFIYVSGYDNASLGFPTSISETPDSLGSYFTAGDEVNKNDLSGAVYLNYLNQNGFSVAYCNEAYNNGGNSGYFMSMTVNDPTTMAIGDIVFFYFEGDSYADVNQLRWSVVSSIDVDSLVLMHSQDAVHFIPIHTTKPLLAGVIAYDYHYSFVTPYSMNYYKVAVYYTDGTIEYSKIINLYNEVKNADINVYPTAYYAGVNIVSKHKINSVLVYNNQGQVLSSAQVGYAGHIHYNLHEIEDSYVFMRIDYGDGLTQTLKLVKYL